MPQMVSDRVSSPLKLVSDQTGLAPAISDIEPAQGSQRLVSDTQIATLGRPQPPHKWEKRSAGGSLYLWISQSGSKLWRWHYNFGGKPQTYSIGPWGHGAGEYLFAAAITEAAKARALVADGINPVRQRQIDRVIAAGEAAKRQAEEAAKLALFEVVAEDWFAAKGRKWSPAYRLAQRSRLDREILPIIGRTPLSTLENDAPRLLELLRGIDRRGKHGVRSKVANILSLVFRYAIATGHATNDPIPDLRGAFERPPVQNRPTIPLKEFPQLFKAIAAMPSEGVTKLALYWCAATVCRTGEMRYATWDEIEDGEIEVEGGKRKHRAVKLWRVTAARMKMRKDWLQPLSPLALTILECAKALRTSDADDALIFPGFSRSGVLSENALLSLLARCGFFGRMTTHGLRSSFSSFAHERGFDPLAVELCLAHRPGGVLGIYNRSEYIPQRLAILTAWGERLSHDGLRLS